MEKPLDTAPILDYAHYMSNYFDHETTIYGSHGEFLPDSHMATWTDEDWQEYDAHVAREMDLYDIVQADQYVDLDPEPPF